MHLCLPFVQPEIETGTLGGSYEGLKSLGSTV